MSLKIGHMSDTHNHIKEIDECIKTQTFIFEESIKNNIDAMVHTGDLWDRSFTGDDLGPQYPIIELYTKYSNNFPILIIKGNHDTSGSLKIFNKLNGSKLYATEEIFETVVLTNEGFKNISSLKDDEIPKGVFHVITYPEINKILTLDEIKKDKNKTLVLEKVEDFLKNSKKLNIWGVPNIVCFHGSIRDYKTCQGQTVPDGDYQLTTEVLTSIEPDYVACGHIHKFQTFYPKFSNVCYAGSTWAINFGEQDEKFFLVLTFQNKKFEQKKILIPTKKRISYEINLEKETLEDLEALYNKILLNKTDYLELDIFYDKDIQDKIKKYKSVDNLKIYKKIIRKQQSNISINSLNKVETIDDEIIFFEKYRNIKIDNETKDLLKKIYKECKDESEV